jgi:hypothetical protein
MLAQHLGLVSEIETLSVSELSRAGAALQKQLTRDLGPIWGWTDDRRVYATRGRPARLLADHRRTGHPPGAVGIHLDQDGQPFALVQFSNRWTLTVSHEVLEMCVIRHALPATPAPQSTQL